MRLSVPKKIKEKLTDILEVWVEYDNTTAPSQDVLKFSVSKLHFKKMDFVNMVDEQWKNCSFARYRVKYLDGSEEVLAFESKESAVYRPLDELGVFLEGKDIRVGLFFENCEASEHIAKANSFNFSKIKDIPAYVINLAQDYDRYNTVSRELRDLGFSNIHRWEAVNAKEENVDEALKYYGIRTTQNFNSSGAIGCSLSHLSLYEDFLNSSDTYRLVFEDDVTAHSKFHELIAKIEDLSMDSFDVLFLGGWFWSFGEKGAVKDLRQALQVTGQKYLLRNPHSFETHAMLISRRFAYKAIDNYRRRQSSGSLLIDNYITESKYFDTCLLTFSPFDSENVDKLQLRNMNNCGLFFQKNVYGSHIQRKEAQGVKEIKTHETEGQWIKVRDSELYRFDNFSMYGESKLLNPFVMSEVGVLILEGGIVSPCGVVGTKEERWVLDLSWFGSPTTREEEVWQSVFNRKKNNRFSTENLVKLPGEALNLFAVWSEFNPCHFKLDSLGMLSLFAGTHLKNIHSFDWVLLPSIQTQAKKDLLRILDLDPAKVIESDTSKTYQFDKLYAPSLYGSPARYCRGAFDYVRELFGYGKTSGLGRLLYVSRENAGRDASNLNEMEQLLHDLGFQKIKSSQLKNYVNLFSEAVIVVGAHGAGLANCLFCSPEATLIELVPDFHQKPYYMSLADSVGMNYIGVLCAEDKFAAPKKSNSKLGEKSFSVDLQLLERLINDTLHNRSKKLITNI